MRPTIDSETDLWSAALGHDERAFGALFDLHRGRVHRHVLRLVDTTAEAEDVTAAAFLDLWRRRDAVRVIDGSVLPWLLVTATNHARNTVRGTRRYRALLDRCRDDAYGADPAALAGQRLHRDAVSQRLHDALTALPADDAALLVLTALEGWTSARAAEAVGLRPDAARTRLTRTRKKLRVLLEDLGADHEGVR